MSEPAPAIPRTLRILDLVSLVAALLALTIYFTGGFREWTPIGRISMTSWIRPLIIAFVAAGVRHWLRPRPSVAARVYRGLREIWTTREVRATLPLMLATRTGVLLIGFLAIAVFGYRPDVEVPWRIYENEFLNLPARWDTGWYLGVAIDGYSWTASRATQQQNIAFFPAYPMLMRYGSLLLGRESMWTGVLISWVSFAGALIYLFRMARDRFGDAAAGTAVALVASYPFAFYFSTAYTESLFLLAIAGSCYHFERRESWPAAAWGLLAGLSRPNGCLLSVVLALLVVKDLPLRNVAAISWRPVAERLAIAATPGIGMLIYSGYMYVLTGNPLQWAVQNAAWGRVYRGIDMLLVQQAVRIGDQGLYLFTSTRTVDALNLSAVIFVLATIWPVYRRLGAPYAALILVNVLPPLSMGGLLSMGRLTSVLFPVFLWLGAAIPPSHRSAWIAGFAMLQALGAAMFFTWRPLY